MQIVWTVGISNAANGNFKFFCEVLSSLERFSNHDWGDLCSEDKQANDYALAHDGRVLGKYNTSRSSIYIIMEWDRSVTTVLFTDEY